MTNNPIPCLECITYSVCLNKEIIKCSILFEYFYSMGFYRDSIELCMDSRNIEQRLSPVFNTISDNVYILTAATVRKKEIFMKKINEKSDRKNQ